MKRIYKSYDVDGGKAAIALTLTGIVGAQAVEVEAEGAVNKITLQKQGVSGYETLPKQAGEGAWSAEDNVLTIKTGQLPVGKSRVVAFLKAGTNTGYCVVIDLNVPTASTVEDEFEATINIVSTYGDGSDLGVASKLVDGDRVVVEVDEDGTHIFNNNGDEIGTFTEDGISLGHHDGLHLDVAVAGQTAIADGEGNHIVEVEGSKVYLNTSEGENRVAFDAATGIVSIVSPDGDSELQLTNDKIAQLLRNEWQGTQEEYEEIETPDENTTYYIEEE